MATATGNKLSNQPPNASQAAPGKPGKTARKLTELPAPSELPKFIKGEELAEHTPFTMYGVTRLPGRYGEKFHFDIAYKVDGVTTKRVLTLSVNRDREAIAHGILTGGPFVNCRIIKLNTSPTTTYWKIIDADDPIPAEVSAAAMTDDDIPF